ncbi:PEP-CTERM sorting domain-containing protein [Crocosphaera sp. Alani8]|uniref:PEP-CTERM sorting domain-containing protein n=1 Tax=Crocosphaera sp. Alani8 TaxID=3038952 RepID=UPI00313ABFD3
MSEVPDGLELISSPISYTGDFDRSVERTFEFDLTFNALERGDYEFPVYALVDGGIVATELDIITVDEGGNRPRTVPEPSSMIALMGLASIAGISRLKRKDH